MKQGKQTSSKTGPLDLATTDKLLRAILVLARTVDHTLEAEVFDDSHHLLSKSKVQILRLLCQRGTQNATQLANYLGVSKPAVSELVDSLVKSKLVARKLSKEDRRAFTLEITPLGRSLFRKSQAQQRQLMRAAMREHNGEATLWIDLLRTMTKALVQADRTRGQHPGESEKLRSSGY